VLWPAFDDKELDKALEWYAQRTRRFGKAAEQVLIDEKAKGGLMMAKKKSPILGYSRLLN
jgi:hypothetical protein